VTDSVVSLPLFPSPGSDRIDRALAPDSGALILGQENQLAASVLSRVVRLIDHGPDEKPASRLFPLVLCGSKGTGKTHALASLADVWNRRRTKLQVAYLSGREWLAQSVAAARQAQDRAWRTRYEASDVFILDGVHEIAVRAAAQQELCAVLDAIESRAGFVLCSAPATPEKLDTLLPALRNRLASGLVVPLHVPGKAVRQRFVEQFLVKRNWSIPHRYIGRIATRLELAIPKLLEQLTQWEQRGRQLGGLTGELIDDWLEEQKSRHENSLPSIAAATARYFELKVSELRSPVRRAKIVAARNVAIVLARKLTSKSLDEIGAYFGGRDHSTILHSLQKTEQLARSDAGTRLALDDLARLLRAG
jgi:chromosomal replication initiator protein